MCSARQDNIAKASYYILDPPPLKKRKGQKFKTSDVDDETVDELNGQIKESLGGNRPEIFSTHPSNTIHSTELLSDKTSQMMPEKDECGQRTVEVNIKPIHLASWQADNPRINPAWLYKEINRVMKNKIQDLEKQLKDISEQVNSLISTVECRCLTKI